LEAARQQDTAAAEQITREVMQESIDLWQQSPGAEL
jgi:hypothetical protein